MTTEGRPENHEWIACPVCGHRFLGDPENDSCDSCGLQSAPETYRLAAAVRHKGGPTKRQRDFKWYASWAASLAFSFLCAALIFKLWSSDSRPADAIKLPPAQARLDDYSFRIDTIGLSPLVEHYEVNGHRMTIKVANEWHYQPYQIRLQAAQKLWQIWADVNVPLSADEAPIRLTDLNGNEVGGVSIFSGAWVQE